MKFKKFDVYTGALMGFYVINFEKMGGQTSYWGKLLKIHHVNEGDQSHSMQVKCETG